MTKMTNINIRVQSELKSDAEELFREIGINMSTAINIFLRYCVNYGGIPFELKTTKPIQKEKEKEKEEPKKDDQPADISFENVKAFLKTLDADE